MTFPISRRDLLGGAAVVGLAGDAGAAQKQPSREPFIFCLNTATIRGQNLPITDEVDIAAKAGYQAIEPWIEKLDRYTQGGGNLGDLARRISDGGLRVESAIGRSPSPSTIAVIISARRRRSAPITMESITECPCSQS